jgi:structural maintenance of chromosome 4
MAPAAVAPAPTATRTRGRPKKSLAPEPAIEAAEATDEEETTVKLDVEPPVEPQTPPKNTTPKKRKSTAPRASIASMADLAPPTPQPSASPESSSQVPATPKVPDTPQVPATPLGDITAASLNTPQTAQTVNDTQLTAKPIKSLDFTTTTNIMDRPLDIAIKSRTMTVPSVEETAPKSRIVLTHLILTNFKSYAGRQEVGPFHASFSSVVGPNGSGKSNVIDSLLFVFGFRASKMRQGKISALIHNSAQYPNLDHCEVAVHFQEVMDQVRIIFTIKPLPYLIAL